MTWMLYGANGYTGHLLANLAAQRGERPVLAGRNPAKIGALAGSLGLDHMIIDLSDTAGLRARLDGMEVVAHCAGPFSATWRPMVDACLASHTHYLDITGEIDVLESIYARSVEAEQAGVVLLPGAGFDVAPSDCLAALLARAVTDPRELDLACALGGGISPGTLKSALEGLAQGGRARVDGELRPVPLAHRQTVAEFPSGPKQVTAVPWGDISSAFRSTGIPTITTYMVVPGGDLIGRGEQFLAPLLRLPAVQRFGATLVDQLVRGPSEQRQAHGRAEFWGRVRGADGTTATAALATPAPYQLTADTVLRAVTRLAEGGITPGAHTPATAFGPAFLTELNGVTVGEVRVR
jgi:short subunit dehydrogenase-like uncharacterized protein